LHRLQDRGLIGVRILPKQRNAGQNHTRRTVTALHRLDVQKRFLKRMQPAVRFESFNRRNLMAAHRADPRLTRSRRRSVDQYRARAALPLAATVLRSGQVKFIAQDRKKHAIRIRVNLMPRAIDIDLNRSSHSFLLV
jgi:hypothetical protein